MDIKSTFSFLKQLKKNNTKEWFDNHRETYEDVKKKFHESIEKIIKKVTTFDSSITALTAKECVFRINRDVRFSKDKAPYKTNIGAYIVEGGKKSIKAGYYLHLEPNNKSMIAGGLYMPATENLSKIREEIDYNNKEFKKILNQKEFKNYFGELRGERLAKAPKGYPADHPEVELLKFKSYTVMHEVTDELMLKIDIETYTAKIFKAMYPFCQFLNRALD